MLKSYRRSPWTQLSVLALGLLVGTACGDDGGTTPSGSFTLTFQLDDSFQGPHGGQAINVAVVRASNDSIVARENGTVSATANPSFEFTTASILQEGVVYEVHYWIDSNFGGGIVGVCDATSFDHQWNAGTGSVGDDVTLTESHDPSGLEDVCDSFSVDLNFSLDASFQGPHGGQEINVAVVAASGGAVIARRSGTVSASADPAFSFSLPRGLTIGAAYEVHYWVDSNFGGGLPGVCDGTANDHQWNTSVAAPSDDVDVTESHDPGSIQGVCSSFAADLTFSGDASFQGAHGGQNIAVMVRRASDGAMVATDNGTVSASADPSFSFSFPGVLVIGQAYDIEYWIDSNFGGGQVGVCDLPSIDHQWRTSVPAVTGDTDVTDDHDPSSITDVCSTPGLVSFANDIQPIFTSSCALGGCHAGGSPAMGMNLSAGQAYGMIVDVASVELPSMDRIEPGMPDLSYLVHKIQGTQASVGGSGSRMPLTDCCLSQAQIDMVRNWVSQGAQNN